MEKRKNVLKEAGALLITTLMVLSTIAVTADTTNNVNFLYKDSEFVPGEIIVKFKNGVESTEISKINSKNGLSVISSSKFAGFQRLKIPQGKTVSEMVDIYKNNPNVEYAEPNYIAHACMVPNDEFYSLQWNFHDLNEGGINMEPAWDIATGSGVVVAIIDTGISVGSDLSGTCFVPGYDFVNNDNDPTDDYGHGTACAGIVAQTTNNEEGIAGIAFNACLMPVKVLNMSGSGTWADIADGIYFAVDNGANIISMSLGASSGSRTLKMACKYAYDNGVTSIAASGNNGQNGVYYPAAYDAYVIAVGATQVDKTKTWYSTYGSSLDLVAPGGNMNLDQNGDGYPDGILVQTFNSSGYWDYYFGQGTSAAAPHVSGVAALLYSKGVTSPDEIRNVLQSNAVDLGSSGWDMYYGYGLINAYAALQYNQFYDSFEVSEWNGLWVEDGQNAWLRSTQRETDGSYSAEVDGPATDTTLTLANAIDLSGKSSATLTYSWFIEKSWDTGEYIALDVYDGTWHEVIRLRGNVDQENTWHQETIDLTPYMTNNFKIRFRAMVSDSSEDGNVDNVKIVSII